MALLTVGAGSAELKAADDGHQLFPFRASDKYYGYINTNGEVVIRPQFEDAYPFQGYLGWAISTQTHAWGLIESTGEFFRSPIYRSVSPFSSGLAAVKLSYAEYINERGSAAINYKQKYLTTRPFSEGIAFVGREDGKQLAINTTNRVLFEHSFDDVKSFGGGLAPVMKGGKWGFIDRSGQVAIPHRFDRADTFSDDLACVAKTTTEGLRHGFIDKTGETRIPFQFAEARPFSEGLAPVRVDDQWGFIDISGKVQITARFKTARQFHHGKAAVQDSAGWTWIDKEGKTLRPPEFDDCEDFFRGFARYTRSGRHGYVDLNGKTIFEVSASP